MLDGTLPFARKTKIVTDDDMPHIQAVHQDPTDKRISSDSAHPWRKPRAIKIVDTAGRERLEFLAKTHESCRWPFNREKLFGRWLEAHDDGRQARGPCLVDNAVEQPPMPQVKAIVCPDCHDAATPQPGVWKICNAGRMTSGYS